MPAKRTSKPNPVREKISFEELTEAGNFSGFDALFQHSPESYGIQGLKLITKTTPVALTPVMTTPVKVTPIMETPVEPTPVLRTGAEVTAVEKTVVYETPVLKTPGVQSGEVLNPVAITPVSETVVSLENHNMLWQTETGIPIPSNRRILPISLAQDALSRTEEVIYNTLWGKSPVKEESRLIKIGLERLGREVRVTEKSVKASVRRMIEKGFIEIASPAVIEHRIPTEYRVFSYGTILRKMREKGRLHVAKIATGVFYALPATGVITTPVAMNVDPVVATPVSFKATPVESATLPYIEQDDDFSAFQHHQLFTEIVGRPPTDDDAAQIRTAHKQYGSTTLMIGMYLTALRSREVGTQPKSFRYFLPEIEKCQSTLRGVQETANYLTYLKSKWKRLSNPV